MQKYTFALLTIILTGALLNPHAYSAEEEGMKEGRARAGIEALMWHYTRALDTLDAEAYAAVFTEDGVFSSGANTVRGRVALMEMIRDLRKAREDRVAKGEPATPPMFHIDTNLYLEFQDADHARIHYYWLTVFGGAGPETPPRVAAAGRGIDDVVRVNGQWLLKSRDVAPQD